MLVATALPAASRLVDARSPITDAEAGGYVRANTDWLADCRFGIGIHWTAQTVPRTGPAKPFAQAVADFDLEGFLAAIERSGADYVLFTIAHALQRLPAPHPVLDRILPGRTCERDLIEELAEALAAKGKPLLLYYNHSCNSGQDALGNRPSAIMRPRRTAWRRTSWRSCPGWATVTGSSSELGGLTAPIPSIPRGRTAA